jgi:hypothetical protein
VRRRILGPKIDDVIGKELHAVYSLPDIIRVIKSRRQWAGNIARMGESRGALRVLVEKPEGTRPLLKS